jgi:transcriptional regulator with XRE-family HTH domain
MHGTSQGQWLRRERLNRGWTVAEMRQRLRAAARLADDTLPDNDCLSGMIRRWERDANGMSERYRLHYCRALRISYDEFTGEPPGGPGDSDEFSPEQLHAEVTRLARDYMTGEPFTLFTQMRRLREILYSALSRKMWLRDQTELCFLIGCLHSLMADAADALGGSDVAQELARAGLGYALAIDHRPLAAQLRLNLAITALWSGLPLRAAELAKSGLAYLPAGPNAAQLQLIGARSAARLGDARTALELIDQARRTREADYTDDLLSIGGEFGFSVASQHYFAGSALVELTGANPGAVGELGRAVELYQTGPQPGEQHSAFCELTARVDLTGALARSGQLDAAIATAGPVLVCPPGRRVASLPKRFGRVRTELATRAYQGSVQAGEFDQQIELFCRETAAALPVLLP